MGVQFIFSWWRLDRCAIGTIRIVPFFIGKGYIGCFQIATSLERKIKKLSCGSGVAEIKLFSLYEAKQKLLDKEGDERTKSKKKKYMKILKHIEKACERRRKHIQKYSTC